MSLFFSSELEIYYKIPSGPLSTTELYTRQEKFQDKELGMSDNWNMF